ncbi:hypothetical protein [Posidoniimonas polymericola]|uniref:hypothetical protein n=1 Tax=Posidoniimonas polymericola TaxID=2528002 RepID=UPI0011B5A979|nr:hypothetical protein [Posidoniimonas polymericola]
MDIAHLERIRRTHLSREATIESLGLVCYLVGVLGIGLLALAVAFLDLLITTGVIELLLVLVYLAFLAVTVWVGIGLRGLSSSARIPGIVLSVIWLLASAPMFNPITLLISMSGLWCLLGKKASYIFTPEYKHVIAATPHVRYKTSAVSWILLAILIIGVLFAMMIPGVR